MIARIYYLLLVYFILGSREFSDAAPLLALCVVGGALSFPATGNVSKGQRPAPAEKRADDADIVATRW